MWFGTRSIVIGFIGVAIILNPSREIFQIGFVLGIFAGVKDEVEAVIVLQSLVIAAENDLASLNDVFQAGVFAGAARDTCMLMATGAEAHEWLQWSGATERKVHSRSDFMHFFDELAPRFGDRSVRVLSVLVPATEMTIFELFQIGPICVLGLLAPQLAPSYSDSFGVCHKISLL